MFKERLDRLKKGRIMDILATHDLGILFGIILNVCLVIYFKNKEVRKLGKQISIMENKLNETIVETLIKALELKDSDTMRHSKRVTDYSLSIGKSLGLSSIEIRELYFGAILHDIGKIGISEFILSKPGRLEDNEIEQIQLHPSYGLQIVSKIDYLKSISPIIQFHHERWDGKGYPTGLSGKNIPLMARIVSVADAYDAMTSDRPYRKALSIEEALSEVSNGMGTQFDPTIAPVLIDIIQSQTRNN